MDARSMTCICSRSRSRTNRRESGISTSFAPRSRRTRPSGRSIRTSARWSSETQARRSGVFALLGIPPQALFGQLLVGLINGSFYAMLSLGLAIIFGLLNIINFAHGAQYMLGAFVAWLLLQYLGLGYWWALIVAPLVVGAFGVVLERTMLRRLYQLDH